MKRELIEAYMDVLFYMDRLDALGGCHSLDIAKRSAASERIIELSEPNDDLDLQDVTTQDHLDLARLRDGAADGVVEPTQTDDKAPPLGVVTVSEPIPVAADTTSVERPVTYSAPDPAVSFALFSNSLDNLPAVLSGLSYEEYDAIDAIRSSTLKPYLTSAKFAEWRNRTPLTVKTLAQGCALHTLVLEGEEAYAAEYAVAPKCDRRTTIGKALWAEHVELYDDSWTILDAKEGAAARGMATAVLAHPLASEYLDGPGDNELVIVWKKLVRYFGTDGTPHEVWVLLKARIDRLTPRALIDLKSAASIEPGKLYAQIARLHYTMSMAMYADGLDAVGLRHQWRQLFIVVENSEPHDVTIEEIDEEEQGLATAEFERALALHVQCVEQDRWPGVAEDEVRTYRRPKWANPPGHGETIDDIGLVWDGDEESTT